MSLKYEPSSKPLRTPAPARSSVLPLIYVHTHAHIRALIYVRTCHDRYRSYTSGQRRSRTCGCTRRRTCAPVPARSTGYEPAPARSSVRERQQVKNPSTSPPPYTGPCRGMWSRVSATTRSWTSPPRDDVAAIARGVRTGSWTSPPRAKGLQG